MKGSCVLKKRWLLCSLFAASLVCAEEEYLSTLKEEQFGFEYRKAKLQNDMLRDSWISPIRLGYSYGKSDQYDGDSLNESASVSIDQPIFRSGGIYYGIKYAEASRRYSNLSIDAARQKLVKEAVGLLMQIRQSDLRIAKQELLIANAGLNLELKTEAYLHGELDSGFLDNAIIDKNVLTQALYDLQTAKERLISAYESISDAPYASVAVPKLSLIEAERFESEAIDLHLAQSEVEKNRWNANVTRAKYLPSVSVNAAYNWNKIENPAFAGRPMIVSAQGRYTSYGFSASMPIDINEWRDMEASRIESLKSGVAMADKKRELAALYQQVRHNLANADKKIALARENRALYEKLLGDTRELFRAGYKTEYDVRMLENSAAIQGIEMGILEYDSQQELLNLYEKVNGAI